MRKKIAAGNWKMNLDFSDARELAYVVAQTKIKPGVEVILGCPTPYLYVINALAAQNSAVHVAAQNAHQADKGAYTGETSHTMLSSIGVNHAIIGHSERREYFNENHKLLKSKVDTLVKNGFNVIFCFGEPLKIRKKKQQQAYVKKQLEASLFHLPSESMDQIILAYEPIWAIGTGVTASPAQAQTMHKFIRGLVKSKYNSKIANHMSILYGGSVKPTNAKELFAKPDVDGGLVGGASLDATGFKSIIKSFG